MDKTLLYMEKHKSKHDGRSLVDNRSPSDVVLKQTNHNETEGNSKLIMIKIIIIIQYDGLRVIWLSTIVLLVM